ncbi:MAG: hypothetical protein ACK4N5_27650, partial [Myxococcales bacterium]
MNDFFTSVWGASATEVYAYGLDTSAFTGRLRKWNGTAWSDAPQGSSGLFAIGMHGTGSNNLWIAGADLMTGDAEVLRYDGATMTSAVAHPAAMLFGVYAQSPTNVFAVGESFSGSGGALIARWNGTSWAKMANQLRGGLHAVWATGANEAWAAGGQGLVARLSNNGWSKVNSGTQATLSRVWASGPADVWFVGEGGTVLRWNGTALQKVNTGVQHELRAVWGTSATDVWVGGEDGTLLHWNGSAFRKVASGTSAGLQGLWAASPTD